MYYLVFALAVAYVVLHSFYRQYKIRVMAIIILSLGIHQLTIASIPSLHPFRYFIYALFPLHLLAVSFFGGVLRRMSTNGELKRGLAPRSNHYKVRLMIWLIIAYSSITLLWSPENDHYLYLLTAIPALVYYVFLVSMLVDEFKFTEIALWDTKLLACLFCAIVLLQPDLTDPNNHGLIIDPNAADNTRRTNYLTISDIGAYAMILGIFLYSSKYGITRKIFSAVTVFLGFWMMVRTSRGELLAALFISCGLLVLRARKTGLFVLLLATVVPLWLMIDDNIFQEFFHQTLQPILVQFSHKWEDRWISQAIETRSDMGTQAISAFTQAPESWFTGLGLNYCEARFGTYPHNWIIQAMVEIGILGLLMFFMLHYYTIKNFFSARKIIEKNLLSETPLLCLFSLYSYHLVANLKRGSYMDYRVFLFAILVEAYSNWVIWEAQGVLPSMPSPQQLAKQQHPPAA